MAQDLIDEASRKYGVPADLLARMLRTESGGDPKAVSPKGAAGLMQLMPATATHYGVTDPFDPKQNVDAGARYMADLIRQYKGNAAAAVAHYNGGTSQGRLVAQGKEPTKTETRNYVSKVIPQGAQTQQPQGGSPPSEAPVESKLNYDQKKIQSGIFKALTSGVSEEDIVRKLASMPETAPRVQAALQAGATPQQIVQSAGGKLYDQYVKDKAEYDPTKGMSTAEKVLAGAGGRMMDYWTGIKQLAGRATPEEMDEKRRLDAPLMATGAGQAGAIGTDVLTSLALPAGAATTAGRVALGAAGGAAQGGLAGVGTGEDRLTNTAIGAGAGAAGGAIARPLERAIEYLPGKVTNVVKNRWANPAEQELFEAAKAAGVTLRPSQQGSRLAKQLEDVQEKLPFVGRTIERARAEQKDEVADAVGDFADSLTRKRAAHWLKIKQGLSEVEDNPAKAARLLRLDDAARKKMTAEEIDRVDLTRDLVNRVILDKTPTGKLKFPGSYVAPGLAAAGGVALLSPDEKKWGALLATPAGLAAATALTRSPVGRRLLMTEGRLALEPTTRRAFEFGTQAGGQTLAQVIRQQLEEENAP